MDYKEKFVDTLKEIAPQASLESKTNVLDSMEFVTLIVSVEEVFEIEFGDEALNANFFSTLEDVFNYAVANTEEA